MANYFKYLVQMTAAIFRNTPRIWALANFEYKLTNKGLALGQLWLLLNPLFQIGIYWFVFGIGLRSGKPVGDIPYVVWLTCGLTPWLICNKGIIGAASSIYSKASVLTRSNIPTYLIPLSTALASVMNGCWIVLVLFAIYLGNGCVPGWQALGLVYYVLCMYAFIATLSLTTSVLVMLARDFSNLIQTTLRMLFFLSPIFWDPASSGNELLLLITKVNPFAYLIGGFRDALLYDLPFWANWEGMAFFWGLVLLLYCLGAWLQSKLRKNLLDFM